MSLDSPSGSGPDVPPSVHPAGRATAAGDEVTTAISSEIVQVYIRAFGRGPTRTRTFVQPQFAVCVLRQIFTSAERALIASGDDYSVEHTRKRLNAANEDDLRAIIASRTGRPVQSHLSEVKVPADLAVHLFLFEGAEVPDGGEESARSAG
jgi:uncharacterized protein YbcI